MTSPLTTFFTNRFNLPQASFRTPTSNFKIYSTRQLCVPRVLIFIPSGDLITASSRFGHVPYRQTKLWPTRVVAGGLPCYLVKTNIFTLPTSRHQTLYSPCTIMYIPVQGIVMLTCSVDTGLSCPNSTSRWLC